MREKEVPRCMRRKWRSSSVRDGNLVTSRKPDDLPAFCREILKVLREIG
jgi:putative intracellular protease/amidase